MFDFYITYKTSPHGDFQISETWTFWLLFCIIYSLYKVHTFTVCLVVWNASNFEICKTNHLPETFWFEFGWLWKAQAYRWAPAVRCGSTKQLFVLMWDMQACLEIKDLKEIIWDHQSFCFIHTEEQVSGYCNSLGANTQFCPSVRWMLL